jgi:hypothetical protein
MNPVHTTRSYLSKIHFNIILPPSGLFPSGFPTRTLYAFLFPHACYIPCPSHPRLDHSNYTWRRVQADFQQNTRRYIPEDGTLQPLKESSVNTTPRPLFQRLFTPTQGHIEGCNEKVTVL